MQKISTMRTSGKNIFQGQLTIGLDLGDRSSVYCVLSETGENVLEHKLATTPEAGRVAPEAAWPEREQIRGKKSESVPNRPSEKRVKTGDAGGRASWRSSLLGDPGVKFFYKNSGNEKEARRKKWLDANRPSHGRTQGCWSRAKLFPRKGSIGEGIGTANSERQI